MHNLQETVIYDLLVTLVARLDINLPFRDMRPYDLPPALCLNLVAQAEVLQAVQMRQLSQLLQATLQLRRQMWRMAVVIRIRQSRLLLVFRRCLIQRADVRLRM